MRPVTLRVAGLRSYRSERTLDFTDRSLMAILGDTGSGKSSLLEALYAALYGASTWDARGGLRSLIADGVKTLQVELVFIARGKTYKVARSTSRDAYPPARHILECLDDGEKIDQERQVTARIQQIVGLSEKEFLRVVILPQGKFGQLLQGTAGERTPILRGILGLGILDKVRDIADRQASELGKALEPLTGARLRLYPNPTAVAAQASADVAQREGTDDRLASAAKSIDAVERAANAIERALPALETALGRVADVDMSDLVRALEVADKTADALELQRVSLEKQRRQKDAAVIELQGKLDTVAAEGFGVDALAAVRVTLDQVVHKLPELQADAAAHAVVLQTLRRRDDALAAAQKEAATVRQEATRTKESLASLNAQERDAATQVNIAQDNIARLTLLLATLEQDRAAMEPLAAAVLTAGANLGVVRSRLSAAQEEFESAARQLETLRDTNRVAHVARDHQPGEPCPVCSRDLPDDFTPPLIVGEEAQVRAVAATKEVHQKAVADERIAELHLHKMRAELLMATTTLAGTASKTAEFARLVGAQQPEKRRAQLASDEVLPAETFLEQAVAVAAASPPANLLQSAADLAQGLCDLACSADPVLTSVSECAPQTAEHIRPLQEAHAAAKKALESTSEMADSLAERAATLEARVSSEAAQLERDKTAHQAETERTRREATRLAAHLATLPPLLAQPLTNALKLEAGEAGHALLTAPPLPVQMAKELDEVFRGRSEQVKTWQKEREAACQASAAIDRQLLEVANTRAAQVDAARSAARVALTQADNALRALAESLTPIEDACERLAQATPDGRGLPARCAELAAHGSSDISDPEMTATVVVTASRLRTAHQNVTDLGQAARKALEQSRANVNTALSAAGVTSITELNEQRSHIGYLLRAARAQLDRAQRQEPVAKALDVGLTVLRRQHQVLLELKDVMNPSAFPNFVVAERQTALLRIASALLGKLTRDAYGFGEDFMIVDRRTGQPRHAKTLSGGETFLASLALALALVEISNRSGGQLDALFLDEGFGSLDATILGDALDVLREQASSGRLVGVISHIHAVAAELDDVLFVTKDIGGSDFRWLNAEERDAFLLDGVAAGLLA